MRAKGRAREPSAFVSPPAAAKTTVPSSGRPSKRTSGQGVPIGVHASSPKNNAPSLPHRTSKCGSGGAHAAGSSWTGDQPSGHGVSTGSAGSSGGSGDRAISGASGSGHGFRQIIAPSRSRAPSKQPPPVTHSAALIPGMRKRSSGGPIASSGDQETASPSRAPRYV